MIHSLGHRLTDPINRGIALVAVLGVLVVLALLAAGFAGHMSMERIVGRTQIAKAQADLLANSAMEHAMSVLRQDALTQPAWDDPQEPMFLCFQPDGSNPGGEVDIDGLPGATSDASPADARWIYVKNKDGVIVGRYAVCIEDESSKINLNVARALNPGMQNEGFGAFEIMLTDGKSAGLPVSLSFAKNILRYRYGRDRTPGQAKVDDNLTASSYASDLVDNDADGIVDEPDEGIDEPGEYDPMNPKWDDRSFSSVREAGMQAQKGKRLSESAHGYLKKFGTVHSRSKDTYWNESDAKWGKQININVASKRQLHSLLRRANEETRFEARSKNMRILVGNLTDYRDENQVLSTMGSEYGVEAVCFNEVMANDGSYTLRADRNSASYEDENRVHRFGWWYERGDGKQHAGQAWKIKSVSKGGKPGHVLTNGVRVMMPHVARVTLKDKPRGEQRGYDVFDKLRRSIGFWPQDMWKNAWLMVCRDETSPNKFAYVPYPIVGNSDKVLYVGYDDDEEYNYGFLASQAVGTGVFNAVLINNLWRDNNGGLTCVFPEMNEYFFFPIFEDERLKNPPKNLYYKVYIAENNLPGNIMDADSERYNNTYVVDYWEKKLSAGDTPWKGFNPMLDVDGIPRSYSETRMLDITSKELEGCTLELPGGASRAWLLRTPYNNGNPVRAKKGYIHVGVATCKQTGYVGGLGACSHRYAYEHKNVVVSAYMMRPDIVELINISDHPISLRNWRIVVNTGSCADEVGRIDEAISYSKWRHGRYDDPNPSIQPNGYFYITNNREIFDREYGSPKNGKWGTSASEAYPCIEVPDTLWGVRYKVRSIREGKSGDKIVCEGARWKKDQMKYEMTEWYLQRPREDQNSCMGVRHTIEGNTRNALDMGRINVVSLKASDSILILGMPREGGFLSMTLKNEYGQIAARTITYGSTKLREINYSTEKLDPTHYNWIKSRRPTFGGTERKARNHSLPRGAVIKPHVKDNRFSSVGEVQLVRKAEDWENIGMERRGQPSTRVLKAIAKYFTVSGIRLDPEEEGAHISGWRPAFGKAQFGSTKNLTTDGQRWEPNIWKHQTLRILSGEQKGESYAIDKSTQKGVSVTGYSNPSGKQLRVRRGDKFSVGPGYATPLYYTRKNNDKAIWEWKDKGLEKADYGLYLYGLNDSTDTTEFLEENRNAKLDVYAFNYATRDYDRLPVPGDRTLHRSADPYRFVMHSKQHQYEKSDGVYCGLIHPDHVSPDGGIRLKIVAHGLNSAENSGFAWFDYAFLAPGEDNGKLNINTASERVLRALNGVSSELARNIRLGTSRSGKKSLLPYKNVTDVLDVKGMTPQIFSKNCNMITTRSDQYRVQVIAETISDVDHDGRFDTNAGDKVLAKARIEAVLDRTELTDDDPGTAHFRVLARN